MNPIRLAVVGAGKLGGYHANIAASSEEFDLVGVVDPVQAARESLAEKTLAQPYASIEDVIGRIDAAVVATPTRYHAEGAQKLLESGVHTLVEKPLAPNLFDADAMHSTAERMGLTLQVGHVERFNPALQAAGDAVNGPKFIQATRTSGYTFRSTDIGAVLDLMIHDIDLVLSIADSRVVDVSAIGFSVLGTDAASGNEDMATAQLRFENGCIAHLTASRVSYELRREMQVFTEEAFTSLDFAKGSATVVRPNADVLARAFDGDALSPERKQELFTGKLFEEVLVKSEHEAPKVNAIELELQDFAQAIRTGEAPTVDGQAGRDAVAVAERVLKSIARHAWDGEPWGRVGAFAEQGQVMLRKSA